MATGAAILAHAGLQYVIGANGLRIDLFIDSSWQNGVATTGTSALSRDGNTLKIDENVDYLNDSGSTQTATQARVTAFVSGIWTVETLFPAATIGSVELVNEQILRFTNISCDINE